MREKVVQLQDSQLLDLYYFMRLGRAIEERLEILYRQGRLPSAIYLGRGQEAAEVGSAFALEPGDVIGGTHRDMMAYLTRGITARQIMAQHFGKATSPTKGKGEDNYLGDLSLGVLTSVSMLPNLYPLVVGAALAFRMRRERRVALGICGEGASSRGIFHEALNLAAVQNLGVVFLVINNQFAYSTPAYREMKVKDVAQRGLAEGMPGIVVDGNDILAVYREVKQAVDRARDGGGPTLVEAKTMRMRGHAGHDPMKYVPKEMLEEWEKKDPIDRYERYLSERGLFGDETKRQMLDRIEKEVQDAVDFAEQSPFPPSEDALKGVFRE